MLYSNIDIYKPLLIKMIMKQNFEIKKVRKQADRKIVNLPKNSDFEIGEYVKISKLEENSD